MYPLLNVPRWMETSPCAGALFGHLISFLIPFPLPLYPLNNSCVEDSAVSDFSLIWFLILSGLDRPALVCYFNLIHQSPLLYRVALLYHVGGKNHSLMQLVSNTEPSRSCVCGAERIISLPLCQNQGRGWALRSGVDQRRTLLLRRKGASAAWEQGVWGSAMITLCIKWILCCLDAGKVHLTPFVTPVLQIMDFFGV